MSADAKPVLGPELAGESKHLTVLFADLVESTRLIAAMDREESAALLEAIQRDMEGAVGDYGGHVLKRMGDGIMAVFGAPLAMEDHAVRAGLAALAMLKLVGARETPDGTRPELRIGINSGTAVIYSTGANPQRDFEVRDPMVNLAARLQALAEPGTIRLGEETRAALGATFECIALGHRQVKGFAAPVPVFALERARSRESTRAHDDHGEAHAPFIGRGAELKLLRESLARLNEGRGAILAIHGEAGIGKTRLIDEARRTMPGRARWIEAAGLSYGRSISYGPIIGLLRSSLSGEEGGNSAEGPVVLRSIIERMFGERAGEVHPYLASVLGFDPGVPLDHLDGEAMGHHLRRALRLYLQQLAQRQPTVIVCEDGHWFDDSSARMVEHVLPVVENESLLFILIGRGEVDGVDTRLRRHAMADHPAHCAELHLGALSPRESADLTTALLSSERLASLRTTIIEKAEGNPLFIEETVRTLCQSGALVRDKRDGVLRLNGEIDDIRVPETIQDVLMARVDRLNEHVKGTLLDASVIGRVFDYKLLRGLTGDARELNDDLTTLMWLDFIEQRLDQPEEYLFRHAILQEATYNSILRGRRRTIHRRVAEALEQLFPGRIDELSGMLAYHFGRAELWDKAKTYLLRAGDRADKLSGDAEALHYYTRAMAAFGNRLEPTMRAHMERKIGEAHFRRGEHAEAFQHFKQALLIIAPGEARLLDQPRRSLARQILTQAVYQVVPSIARARRGGGVPDRQYDEVAEIFRMLGWMEYFHDHERLATYTLTHLNVSQRRSYHHGIAIAAASAGFICDVLGLHALAARYQRQAARAAERSSNPLSTSTARMTLAWHHAYVGAWDRAMAAFIDAADVSWRCGDVMTWGSAMWGRGMLGCQRGELAVAWDTASRFRDVGEETAHALMMRWSTLCRAMILARVGRFAEAEGEFQTALDQARLAVDRQLLAHTSAELATCLLDQDKIDGARSTLETATSMVRESGLRGHHVEILHAATATLRVAQAERAATASRGEAMALARRAIRRSLQGERVFRGIGPAVHRQRARLLWFEGRREDAHASWERSLSAADALGARHERALTLRARGELAGDGASRRQGEALLDELAAPWSRGTAVT